MKVLKVISAVMLSAVTLVVAAQGNPGYVTDGSGKIVQTGSGLCLHTGSWTPQDAVKGCDPVPEVKVAQPVTLNSDVLFQFDSARLTKRGREELDKVAQQITGGNVKVVGHADRIGSAAYNQTLSEARAQAVAKYLYSKTKANYMPSGVGSTQPTAKTKRCSGVKDFEKLKKCLAPDRRVTLTFTK